MGDDLSPWPPDDTRISALGPDERALDAASRSTTNAGAGPLDEQDDTGEPASGRICRRPAQSDKDTVRRHRVNPPQDRTRLTGDRLGRVPRVPPKSESAESIDPDPATKGSCGTDGSGSHMRQIAEYLLHVCDRVRRGEAHRISISARQGVNRSAGELRKRVGGQVGRPPRVIQRCARHIPAAAGRPPACQSASAGRGPSGVQRKCLNPMSSQGSVRQLREISAGRREHGGGLG
jgi:hypothetical protein